MQIHYLSIFCPRTTVANVCHREWPVLQIHFHSHNNLFIASNTVKCMFLIWVMSYTDAQSMSLFTSGAFAPLSHNHPFSSFCPRHCYPSLGGQRNILLYQAA